MKSPVYKFSEGSSRVGKLIRYIFKFFGFYEYYKPIRTWIGKRHKHNPIKRFLFMGMYDFILHELYWLCCTVKYRLVNSEIRVLDNNNHLISLKNRGFTIIVADETHTQELEDVFWSKFDKFQSNKTQGYRPSKPVLWKGMMAYPAVADNQIHYDEITQDDCYKIFDYISSAGVADISERFINSKISVSNMRVWRYLSSKQVTVPKHVDNLPPHSFKIMYFRGLVDEDNGALVIYDYENERHIVKGKDLILIVDVNCIPHESENPLAGKYRDCIEICVLPELKDNRRIQYSGFEAEHPYNPFKSWDKPAQEIIPLKPFGRSVGRLIAR